MILSLRAWSSRRCFQAWDPPHRAAVMMMMISRSSIPPDASAGGIAASVGSAREFHFSPTTVNGRDPRRPRNSWSSTSSPPLSTLSGVDYYYKPRHYTQRSFSSYPPHQVVGLPSLSPTMESGSIANWVVKEGDSFAVGDIFCSVETDKATVDFEAQEEGVVAKILAPAGPAEIKVGSPIMVTVDQADLVPAFAAFTVDAAAPAAAAAAAPTPTPAAAPAPVPPPPPAAPAAAAAPAPIASTSSGRVFASPLARMMAKEKGFDVSAIPGTGPQGRVVAADVREYVPAAAATTTTPMAATTSSGAATAPATMVLTDARITPIAGPGYTDYPLTDQAREVARRLLQAKRNVPHYYLTVDICVDALLELRSTLNATLAAAKNDNKSPPTTLGVYELLLKAAAMSMKAVPAVNGSWMDQAVRVYDQVDINVVLGSGATLTTPIIRDAGRQGVQALSRQLQAAMENGDSGVGSGVGTFTVLNVGMYGVKSCAPIIREPQACALALGALETRIVPRDEEIDDDDDDSVIYKEAVMMTATLSCDHRVVDGAVGAQWLAAFKAHVEQPTTLLL